MSRVNDGFVCLSALIAITTLKLSSKSGRACDAGYERSAFGDKRQIHPCVLTGCALLAAALAFGCARMSGAEPAAGALELKRDVTIPPATAHTVFQGGRQVMAAGIEQPYCELEIQTVSESEQMANAGRYPIRSARFALLRDPVTRIPALMGGFDCSDPLFQESLWLVSALPGGNMHSLRCIRPGFHCQIGPPITLSEIAPILGPGLVEPVGGSQ